VQDNDEGENVNQPDKRPGSPKRKKRSSSEGGAVPVVRKQTTQKPQGQNLRGKNGSSSHDGAMADAHVADKITLKNGRGETNETTTKSKKLKKSKKSKK